MDFDIIRSFLMVANCENMTEAAKNLFITQSALSHQIRRLENTLGTVLIYRNKGKQSIELTPSGKIFAVRAEKILDYWEETKEKMLENKKDKYLFIMSTGSLGFYGLETFVHRVLTESPNSTFSTNVGKAHEIIDLLENNEIDIGLVCHEKYSGKVKMIPIAVEELNFVCRKDSNYPDILSVKDLNPEEELYFIWNRQSISWHDYWFGNKGHFQMIHGSLLYLKYMFQEKKNWAILPTSIYRSLGPDFKTCRLSEEIPNRYLYLAVNSSRGLSDIHEKLLKILKESISSDFTWLDSADRIYENL